MTYYQVLYRYKQVLYKNVRKLVKGGVSYGGCEKLYKMR
jgi:hypothetical protein